MALERTDNRPLVIIWSLSLGGQLTFLSTDNHLVLWQPWETSRPPPPLPELPQSDLSVLLLSVFPSPPASRSTPMELSRSRVASFLFYIPRAQQLTWTRESTQRAS